MNTLLIISVVLSALSLVAVLFAALTLATLKTSSSLEKENLLTRFSQIFLESDTKSSHHMREVLEFQFQNTRKELQETLVLSRREQRDSLLLTTKDLETKFQTLEQRVAQQLDVIGRNVQSKLDINIQEGFKHFQLVTEGLANAEKQLANLTHVGSSINELNNLLKLPHLRGNFGETALERLLADFLPAGSFVLQYEVTPNSQERVDAVVKFPNVVLPIDSKFPREQVLPLFEKSEDPQSMALARKTLSEIIRGQAKSIANKYIKPEFGTTDLALMFLPSETLYFEVIRDTDLWEALSKQKVFPTSPNTLAISLQFIGRSMHYYETAQNVKKLIHDLAKARKHFENFQKKFDDIGRGLEKAQDAFSTATRHLGTYRGSVNRLAGEVSDSAAGLESPGPELGSEDQPLV